LIFKYEIRKICNYEEKVAVPVELALRLPFRLSAPQRVSEFPENPDWADLKNRRQIMRLIQAGGDLERRNH
jgi:hypothetical protein